MKRYIAFLRGINISGKNKISMAELKKNFEELGFEEVKTYLNSGNVIFLSDEENIGKLNQELKDAQERIESLKVDLSSRQNDLGDSEGKKAKLKEELDNVMSKIFVLENTIKEKRQLIVLDKLPFFLSG